MNTVVALIGPHGAGKTSLGRVLGPLLGVCFEDEVGRRLADDPRLRPAGTLSSDAQPAFDEAVFRAECRRDRRRRAAPLRLVESWHPGNLAFAQSRTPGHVERWLPSLRAACGSCRVVAVPVWAPTGVLAGRQTHAGTTYYFETVALDAVAWARALGAKVLEPVWTHEEAPVELAGRLAQDLAAAWLAPQEVTP